MPESNVVQFKSLAQLISEFRQALEISKKQLEISKKQDAEFIAIVEDMDNFLKEGHDPKIQEYRDHFIRSYLGLNVNSK